MTRNLVNPSHHSKRSAFNAQRLATLFEHQPNPACLIDANGDVIDMNQSFERLTGLKRVEFLPVSIGSFVSENDRVRTISIFGRAKSGEINTFETRFIAKDQHEITVKITVIPVLSEDSALEIYLIIEHMVNCQQELSILKHLSHFDELTNLPNRTLLKENINIALQKQLEASYVALLVIDLDHFKSINNTLGLETGDELLRMVVHRLLECSGEPETIFRIGGDEFAIVIPNPTDISSAKQFAQGIIENFHDPFYIGNKACRITLSVGLSVESQIHTTANQLLRNAEIAMYKAKQKGNSCVLYEDTMKTAVHQKFFIESALQTAVNQHEFFLNYQPQVKAKTGVITGVEALVRWQNPEKGIISPAEFISIAEETGLIIPLGTWILKTACTQAKKWQIAGYPPLRIAVNISPKQFMHPNFISTVKQVLTETAIQPNWLELEITENVLIQDIDLTLNKLHTLRQLDVKLSIDDFGTGYSSLNYLRQFPIHRLKVDKSFISDIESGRAGQSIAATIIAMAKNLQLTVVAEGVENERQLHFLLKHGCDEIQGYFFSKPVDERQFENLLIQKTLMPKSIDI